MNWQALLDPLYDVSIGPFAFDLISKCDAVGKSEILTWYAPISNITSFDSAPAPDPAPPSAHLPGAVRK